MTFCARAARSMSIVNLLDSDSILHLSVPTCSHVAAIPTGRAQPTSYQEQRLNIAEIQAMAPQLPLVRPFQPFDSCITSNRCNPLARDTPRHHLKVLESFYGIPHLGLDLN
jgi:hypothetical protein